MGNALSEGTLMKRWGVVPGMDVIEVKGTAACLALNLSMTQTVQPANGHLGGGRSVLLGGLDLIVG